MRIRLVVNALLVVAALGTLLFVGSEAWEFGKSFIAPQSAAGSPHDAHYGSIYEGMSQEEIGKAVLGNQGCLSCHQLDLEGGIVGPSFSNVGVRWTDPDRLRTQIVNAHELYPGSYMPSFADLTETEVEGLVAYLQTLTGSRQGAANQGEAEIVIPQDADGNPRFSEAQVERGRQLYTQQGCVGCHAINGIAPGGNTGPNLTHEAQRDRSDAWQRQHLIEPLSVYVDGEPQGNWAMPSYSQLSEEEITALVAFLQSLR